jgi:hypothetical protein
MRSPTEPNQACGVDRPCAVLLVDYAPSPPAREPVGQFVTDVRTILSHPSCLVLAFAFFAYSCQIFSLSFALPLLLTSARGMPLGMAGLASAFVLAVSTIGHLSSGFLLRAGLPIWTSIAAAFGCYALTGLAAYRGVLPPGGTALTAALASGSGGLAPAALLGLAAALVLRRILITEKARRCPRQRESGSAKE